ncbi:hypothetical protein Hamer_G008177 [Homarus americanus]|uniref:Uncharacterized protein n=1 Tax=Homarus americanus TaxID=6706 RepID=A0A8J5TLA5_HOMAM|nr:hypothetical protein Hamer_G008177 [Homarus americanus]
MRLQGAHDDPVVEVSWLLCSLPVSWTPKRQPFRLLGLVNASPTDEPHNIHFTQVEYSLAGNFTCEVSTANDVARQTYFLHVVDAFSSPYKTNVHVFEMINNSSGIKEENKFQYEVDGSDPSQNVNFENAACTLVWTFSTPAIFPRPNVTCGYYSFDYDDVIHRLPAGLTMHKFDNGSWQASFDSTHIEVLSIPRSHRLGCTVRIPDTTYKKVIKADDDFFIDNLIDSTGCPSLSLIHNLGLNVEVRDATYTCRDDILPADRSGTAVASLSCPDGHAAVFPEGVIKHDWNLELSCSENDIGWRTFSSEEHSKFDKFFDLNNLPYCEPRVFGSAHEVHAGSTYVLLTLLSLAAIFNL